MPTRLPGHSVVWLQNSSCSAHRRNGRRGADDVDAADGHQHLGERHLACVVDTRCRRLLAPRQADAELNHSDDGADDHDDERGGRNDDGQDVVVNDVNDGPGSYKTRGNRVTS